ncbi:MAG TPA: hypothetical protein VEB21_18405 [Terriglobales bacterium]|nr:hypothetical protein [Terriglobales bacterium]
MQPEMPRPDAAEERWQVYGLLAAGILLALLVRLPLLTFVTSDYEHYTSDWYEIIRTQGGAQLLRSNVPNYTPLYLYGLIAVEWLLPNVQPVVAIKLVGLPFDFLLAAYVGAIVSLRYSQRWVVALAALAVLFAPTVVLNGAFWGQVDAIAATGVVACVYYLLRGQHLAAMIAYGLALSFKLQPIFLAPALVVLALRGRFDWRWAGLVPAIYLLTIVPAWLAGRPLAELAAVYVGQAGFYQRLASNVANVFAWLPAGLYSHFYPAGLAWGVAVISALTWVAAQGRAKLTEGRMLQLALLSVLVMPYCLPKMHDRYFFFADVLSIAYAFHYPRRAWVAVAVTAVSFCSYSPYLFREVIVPFPLLAFVPGAVILALLYEAARTETYT